MLTFSSRSDATLPDVVLASAFGSLPETTRRSLLDRMTAATPELVGFFRQSDQVAVYINEAGLRMLDHDGVTDCTGLKLRDLVAAESRESLQKQMVPEALEKGYWHGDCVLRDLQGHELPVTAVLTAHPATEEDEQGYFCLVGHDYCAARLAHDSLIFDRELLCALLDHANDCIYFKDRASRFLRISRAMARKLGLADPRDAIGKTDFNFFSSEHAVPAFNDEQEILRTGQPVLDLEERETWDDGRVAWVSTTKLPLRDTEGRLIGTFGISRDITTRRQAEEAIRQNEMTLRSTFAAVPVGIAWMQNRTMRKINGVITQITGFTEEELIGQPARIVYATEAEFERVGRELYAELLSKGQTSAESIWRRKDGVLVDVLLKAAPLDPADPKAGEIITVIDITERKQAEAERREMEARLLLAQKLESVGRLAAGVAHEVNTPTQFVADNVRFLTTGFAQLNAIIASYRALKEKAAAREDCAAEFAAVEAAEKENELDYLAGEIPRTLEQSLEGLGRIARIVGSLKEFSHPNATERSLADLNRAIETAVAVSRHEWKYVADVVTELDPELPGVPCVLDEVNQAILNLIINAAHAISDVVKQTGGRGRITVRTRLEPGWAIIEVADTGTGIPAEIRPRIFEPFFTTKGLGQGTGQGLAIVHSVIVKGHHGRADFTTEVGRGTTFRLALPVARTDDTAANANG